jgi:hypothetical protein
MGLSDRYEKVRANSMHARRASHVTLTRSVTFPYMDRVIFRESRLFVPILVLIHSHPFVSINLMFLYFLFLEKNSVHVGFFPRRACAFAQSYTHKRLSLFQKNMSRLLSSESEIIAKSSMAKRIYMVKRRQTPLS